MPGRWGRVYAPGFCRPELRRSTLTLEMRPRWLWKLVAGDGSGLVIRLGDLAWAFPVVTQQPPRRWDSNAGAFERFWMSIYHGQELNPWFSVSGGIGLHPRDSPGELLRDETAQGNPLGVGRSRFQGELEEPLVQR